MCVRFGVGRDCERTRVESSLVPTTWSLCVLNNTLLCILKEEKGNILASVC